MYQTAIHLLCYRLLLPPCSVASEISFGITHDGTFSDESLGHFWMRREAQLRKMIISVDDDSSVHASHSLRHILGAPEKVGFDPPSQTKMTAADSHIGRKWDAVWKSLFLLGVLLTSLVSAWTLYALPKDLTATQSKATKTVERSLKTDEDGPLADICQDEALEGEMTSAILSVGGMSCTNCTSAVKRALLKLEEVQGCEIDLVSERATVRYYASDRFDARSLCAAVEAVGFQVLLIQDFKESLKQAWAFLHLMDSTTPSKSAKFLRGYKGVLNVRESQGHLRIAYDPLITGARRLLEALTCEGNSVTWDPSGSSFAGLAETGQPAGSLSKDLLTALCLTGAIVVMCWLLPCFEHCRGLLVYEVIPGLQMVTLLMCVAATPVMLYCGRQFHVGAWHSLKSGVWDMNVLISLGTGLAYSYSMVVVLFVIVVPQALGYHHVCKSPPASYFETPCTVIAFLLMGKSLQSWAKQKTSQSLRDLMTLRPLVANLMLADSSSGQLKTVPAELLEVGDILQVYPGETAPTDSIMVNETSKVEFDESLLTGESRPVNKRKGDFIVGGSRCLTGRAELRVERIGNRTTLNQIAILMEKAQLSRAPVQKVADVVACVFVPCVVELACLTWMVWYILVFYLEAVPASSILVGLARQDSEWPELDKFLFVLEHGLTVLLVACPCALGLATPTAVMTSTGVAAKHGILVKSGAVPLELGSRITHIVLDKTGTLTSGKPRLKSVAAIGGAEAVWERLLGLFRSASAGTDSVTPKDTQTETLPFVWLDVAGTKDSAIEGGEVTEADDIATSRFGAALGECERALWWAVGAAELSSEHPLAKELVMVAGAQSYKQIEPAGDFENITGVGVKGKVGGTEIFVGSASHVSQLETSPLAEWINESIEDGCTVVVVVVDGTPLAAMALCDFLTPDAETCIHGLQASGVEVWMCTGDNCGVASKIGRECKIDARNIIADALPAKKVDLVHRLQEGRTHGKRNIVAMVGDGINDAPALAAADVGIAIGAGHNVTVEAADVVLVRSDIRDLKTFISLARETLSTIWSNFLWAFVFNLCALPIASGALWRLRILMTPQIAVCLMMASSLFVLFSSLSLRRFQPV